MSSQKVVPLFRFSLKVESLYATAWTMCLGSTRARLISIGVRQPIDLYTVRTCRCSENLVFRGHIMEADVLEAYLEFREKVIQEGVRRKISQPSGIE